MFSAATAAFHRRLDPKLSQPVAVAFSGGGDSLAALIATLAWAKAHKRPVLALTVDHGIQSASGDWTAWAGKTAARLGARFDALTWDGVKPATGLAATARRARHVLLAQAARQAGASVLVTGHTEDDLRENAVLGQGALSEWSPSPVWPEGRDLFLLRPLLADRRAFIRDALRSLKEGWIDDPANEDLSSPRVRARKAGPPPAVPSRRPSCDLAQDVFIENGAFRLGRARFLAAPSGEARHTLAAALTCAGGGEAPPRGQRLSALIERLVGDQAFTATLCGAKLFAGEDILIVRNSGEAARGGLAAIALAPGAATVWDGRYEVEAEAPGLQVAALQGHAARLPAPQRMRLAGLPVALRPSLPVILGGPAPTCPVLAPDAAPVRFRALAAPRFLAACGAIAQEKPVDQRRHGATVPSVLC